MESRLKRGISGSGPPTRFYNMSWKRRHSCEDSVRDDGTFSFIFRPHTFSSLLILLGFLSYMAFSNEEVDDFNTNVKRGLYAVAVVFVAFGYVRRRSEAKLGSNKKYSKTERSESLLQKKEPLFSIQSC